MQALSLPVFCIPLILQRTFEIHSVHDERGRQDVSNHLKSRSIAHTVGAANARSGTASSHGEDATVTSRRKGFHDRRGGRTSARSRCCADEKATEETKRVSVVIALARAGLGDRYGTVRIGIQQARTKNGQDDHTTGTYQQRARLHASPAPGQRYAVRTTARTLIRGLALARYRRCVCATARQRAGQ